TARAASSMSAPTIWSRRAVLLPTGSRTVLRRCEEGFGLSKAERSSTSPRRVEQQSCSSHDHLPEPDQAGIVLLVVMPLDDLGEGRKGNRRCEHADRQGARIELRQPSMDRGNAFRPHDQARHQGEGGNDNRDVARKSGLIEKLLL